MPADDLLPEQVNAHESADLPAGGGKGSFIRRTLGIILEVANPFDGVFEMFSDHEALAGVLVFIVATAVVVLFIAGFWSVIQEAFVGGGPQGLGIK